MKRLLLALGAMILTTSAPAATYNEATQGDLGDVVTPGSIPTLQLGFGENVISGSAFFGTADNTDSFDIDAFGFRIPEGGALHPGSITFRYNITGLVGDIWALSVGIRLGSGQPFDESAPFYSTGDRQEDQRMGPMHYIYNDGRLPRARVTPSPIGLELFQVVSSSVEESLPAPVFGPGLYWMAQDEYGKVGNTGLGPWGGSWDYSLTLTVTPIPEPATFTVLLAMAGLLARQSWRNRSSTGRGGNPSPRR